MQFIEMNNSDEDDCASNGVYTNKDKCDAISTLECGYVPIKVCTVCQYTASIHYIMCSSEFSDYVAEIE